MVLTPLISFLGTLPGFFVDGYWRLGRFFAFSRGRGSRVIPRIRRRGAGDSRCGIRLADWDGGCRLRSLRAWVVVVALSLHVGVAVAILVSVVFVTDGVVRIVGRVGVGVGCYAAAGLFVGALVGSGGARLWRWAVVFGWVCFLDLRRLAFSSRLTTGGVDIACAQDVSSLRLWEGRENLTNVAIWRMCARAVLASTSQALGKTEDSSSSTILLH